MSGGRTLLGKILKGSKEKRVLDLGLNKSPVYGFYSHLGMDQISARIDCVIVEGYPDLEYDYRLPLLVYTPKGWEIERDTYAAELFRGFGEMLNSGADLFNMGYLKDKNREVIWLLLDKVQALEEWRYIPILEAWEKIDYKQVRKRIRQVIRHLNRAET